MSTNVLGQEAELTPFSERRARNEKGTIISGLQKENLQSLKSQGSSILPMNDNQPSILNNLIIENTAKKVLDNTKLGINQIHDEKVDSNARKPNFHFHGEDYFFAENSLCFLNEKNRVRLILVRIMTHR
jgi:hypothetical protein